MGLLDDVPPLMPRYRSKHQRRVDEEQLREQRFADLQNLGHSEQSADFTDSPFADRQPKKEEEQI